MKKVFLLLFAATLLLGFEAKTDLEISHIGYSDFSDETVFSGNSAFQLDNDSFTTNGTIDALYSERYDDRRYLELNELFVTKEYEKYRVQAGKVIKFWGELEGYNIGDVFNRKNLLKDPFSKEKKLGSWSLSGTRYFDSGSLELGAKVYEEDQKYPENGTPYAPFQLEYDKELLLSDKRETPTFFLKYAFPTDTVVESENRFILINGYDSKRYFVLTNQNRLAQYAYRSNKGIFLSNMMYEDYIFKFEGSVTDVSDGEQVSDYSQFALGIEKTLYDLSSADLTLFAEYYDYGYKEKKLENVDLSELYDNDLFLALRINFNDVSNSQIKGGILHDLASKEEVLKLSGERRIHDGLVLGFEILRVVAKENSILTAMSSNTRGTLSLTQSF